LSRLGRRRRDERAGPAPTGRMMLTLVHQRLVHVEHILGLDILGTVFLKRSKAVADTENASRGTEVSIRKGRLASERVGSEAHELAEAVVLAGTPWPETRHAVDG